MAIQGPIQVDFGAVFPDGAYAAGKVEMLRDFDRSQRDRIVQQMDKETGLPVWVIEVIDAQEGARQRMVKVKLIAEYQPVLPAPLPGAPFTAIEFEGLMVTPYVDDSRCHAKETGRCGARVAYSLKATGIRGAARMPGRPAPEHKDAA